MFKSKVVVVTGSSAGIGAGTAIHFAREGAAGVVLHGRNEEALREVKLKVEEAGKGVTRVEVCTGDITLEKVRRALIEETVQQFGRLDILVNNAGFNIPGTVTASSIDTYDKTFDVNVRAVVATTQLAIPHLIKTGGNIVNVSSIVAFLAKPEFTFYCMSKATLDHFTRCLAVELGPKGVRVNSVNPGFIPETDFPKRMGLTPEQVKKLSEQRAKDYPLGRVCTVDDVTDQIIHLASDKAKFITGISLPVEGGGSVA